MVYPIINNSDWIFRETFDSLSSVLANGGEINGNPTISNGYVGAMGQSVSYDKLPLNFDNSEPFSIRIKFNATSISGVRTLAGNQDLVTAYEGYHIFLNTGVLTFTFSSDFGGLDYLSGEYSSVLSTFTDYEVVITYDGSLSLSGVEIYINGSSVSVNSVRDSLSGSTISTKPFRIGGRSTAANEFIGNIYFCDVYNKSLSDEEVNDLYDEVTFSEVDDIKALVSLPLRSHYFDGADQVTENIGSLGGTIILGDGTTSTTFPTQVTPKGMSFDGGDYLESENASLQLTGDVTFGCYIKPISTGTKYVMIQSAVGETEATNTLYSMFFNGSLVVGYLHEYSSGLNETSSFTTALTEGVFNHVYFVRDDTAKTVSVYLNGEYQENYTYGTSATGGSSTTLNIGTFAQQAGTFMTGTVSLPRVFPFALTSTQMKFLYDKDRRLLNE